MGIDSPPSASSPRTSFSPRTDREIRVGLSPDGNILITREAMLWGNFAFFMSELLTGEVEDLDGVVVPSHVLVEAHQQEWCDLYQNEARVCLMAPRDHGKTWVGMAYLLWRCWRHNRGSDGLLLVGDPDGRFQAVLFSETLDQATIFFETFQSLFLANAELFGDILPNFAQLRSRQLRDVWSNRRIRLRNGAQISIRGWRTSTRGMHPDLIMLDDVQSDKNTLTAYQRNKNWTYFVGTLLPMGARQYIVTGTALHYDDLLHRLRKHAKGSTIVRTPFAWRKYRAVHWDSGTVLWPAKHDLPDLIEKREFDAILFAREYQNDPRDDASSLFPLKLTEPALRAGADLTLLGASISDGLDVRWENPMVYRRTAAERIILSADFALSGEAAADYCVILVAAIDLSTQKRRLIAVRRGKGWDFHRQVLELRLATAMYGVDLGVMEHNAFQRWVYSEVQKYPETVGRIIGHQTGAEKQDLKDGVPGLVIELATGTWIIPSGDRASEAFAKLWQMELNAFGWKDDKLQGVGEHDDIVMAFWLLSRAGRIVNTLMSQGDPTQYVQMEDVGIERVRIGEDWDEVAMRR